MRIFLPIALLCATLCFSHAALARNQTVTLTVPTMDCSTCPITIKAALVRVPGVISAKVSYPRREAVIVYDDAKTSIDELKKATSDAGYPSLMKTLPN